MMSIELLFGFLLIIFWVTWEFVKNYNYEPRGPYGVPFFGYLPFLRLDAHKQFMTIAKKYGNVFCINVGFKKLVVLNGWKAIKEALQDQSDIFSGRPDIFLFNVVLYKKDIFSCDGPINRQQRRFVLGVLRDFGVGTSRAEKIIAFEAENLIKYLRKTAGSPVNVDGLFFITVLNVSWSFGAGKRFDHDDTEVIQFADNIKFNFKIFSTTNIINYLPALRYLDLKSYNQFLANNVEIYKFMQQAVDEHMATFNQQNEHRDLTDAFIDEMKKRNGEVDSKTGKETHPFTDASRLLGILYNFMNDGVETTAVTLYWGVLLMTSFPEIQKRVQEEMDKIIGKSRYPEYSDRHLLHYTLAVTMEIQRYASILPLAVAHRTIRATKLFGYDIPGNVEVVPNLYSVHHDPELWGDPEVFRPERFLDDENTVRRPEYFVPFSVGGRYCVGEKLARMEIFLLFTYLMQNFTFRVPIGHPTPDFEPEIGITLRPKPFSVIMDIRN